MNIIFLLMACGVLAGLPAALLVFATDSRFCRDDDDDDDDEWLYCSQKTERAARLLRSDATQEQLHAFIVFGEVALG